MKLIQYLLSIGYKPFRYSKNGLVPCDNPYDFSTMREGGLDVKLIKDNSTFLFGLNERNKSPTLKYPRLSRYQGDAEVDRFLRKNSDKEVFEILFKYSIKK